MSGFTFEAKLSSALQAYAVGSGMSLFLVL